MMQCFQMLLSLSTCGAKPWHGGAAVDSFFPRCYDLTPEANETRAFHVDFKWTLVRRCKLKPGAYTGPLLGLTWALFYG
jgi:hypothetical protein